ncbi:MAG: magnesium transporter [Bacteroidetes bacterium]|nr:MAG: magnesium transporter [Bacteroidota bacterium]
MYEFVPKEKTHKLSKVERVRRLLKSENAQSHIRSLMRALHPTEIAQVLEDTKPEIQEKILRQLPKEVISEALSEMDEETHPGTLLTRLRPEVAASLIKELAPDDAADLLSQIPEDYKEQLLSYMPDEEEEVINQLMEYEEDTAGGLMNPEMITVKADMPKLDALREVVRQSEGMEDFYTIYVVDEENRLVGYLTFKALFQARNSELVRNIMNTDVISVRVDDDQEEVAKIMAQYNLPTLPVVDHENRLLGRITFDDILDVIEEESTEDLLNFAGVSEDENLRGGWANSVKSRLPWLLINLGTASTAAFVLSQFEEVISSMAVLATFMPIIAGVAGNGATQTLAVTVRRISTDGIPSRKALGVIFKELAVGIINGLMLGAMVAIGAMYFNEDYRLGAVVGFAMCANLILAGLMGSMVPILLERVGVDPAVASSILITAFTDILGYLFLFSLATAVLF